MKNNFFLKDVYTNLENTKICVTAYNKKQEFYGSLLQIQNSNCENYVKSSYFDNNSSSIPNT